MGESSWASPSLLPQGLLSEEELAGVEQASATAAEVTSNMMRLKLEVEEKKRSVTLLQTALVRAHPSLLMRISSWSSAGLFQRVSCGLHAAL